MKKAYQKPVILFESFAVAANIAAGCEAKTNLSGPDACGWKPDERWEDGPIFTLDLSACEVTPDKTGYATLCYHNPYDTYNLFNS